MITFFCTPSQKPSLLPGDDVFYFSFRNNKKTAPPWVGSRSPDGWDQIPRWAGGWVLHQTPWSFGFDSQTRGTRSNRAHPVLKYRVPHGLAHGSHPNARSLSHSPSAPPPPFTQSPYPPRSLVRAAEGLISAANLPVVFN